ncbi:LIC10280 family protein [Maliponia aquimaris]|uniref:MORN repeat protein n=1 Tax=Maliponia aquimaris TaxID=1673631 RepID=A0A238L655_9RHOB|nr:hypothetical protein [Maliponia aquimaris]SMX50479.1 hypothetical protein MAA8898_04804 [Maliponia aquimaris]
MRALLLAALLTATPLAAQDTGQFTDLTGSYRVEGRNPDGSAYSGTLTLTASGPRYIGDWTIAGQSFRGSGTLDGRILTLQWSEGAEPVVYVLMPDGALHGTWADGRALDRLEPQR